MSVEACKDNRPERFKGKTTRQIKRKRKLYHKNKIKKSMMRRIDYNKN